MILSVPAGRCGVTAAGIMKNSLDTAVAAVVGVCWIGWCPVVGVAVVGASMIESAAASCVVALLFASLVVLG